MFEDEFIFILQAYWIDPSAENDQAVRQYVHDKFGLACFITLDSIQLYNWGGYIISITPVNYMDGVLTGIPSFASYMPSQSYSWNSDYSSLPTMKVTCPTVKLDDVGYLPYPGDEYVFT